MHKNVQKFIKICSTRVGKNAAVKNAKLVNELWCAKMTKCDYICRNMLISA